MTKQNIQKNVFPIIDIMVNEAIADIEGEGSKISCKKGCDHCCHLLVEISYEEAQELVNWINSLEKEKQHKFIKRVVASASEAKKIFNRKKSRHKFLKPFRGDESFDDDAYDEYFYEKKRPCPFLDEGFCQAYIARPSPCRLHLVTSDPSICSNLNDDDSEFEVPERIDVLKQELGGVLRATQPDGRWGQLSIMVEAVLNEKKLQKKFDNF